MNNYNDIPPVRRRLPWHISLVILAFDILAFTTIMAIISEFGLWQPVHSYHTLIEAGSQRAITTPYYIMLFSLIGAGFILKGHYTQRVPWWTQAMHIIEMTIVISVFDLVIRGILELPIYFPNSVAIALITILLLILARLTSIQIVIRLPRWKLPLIVIGDAQIITDCFYAFYADGFTGYEIKKVLLQNHERNPLDLSFLPDAHPPVDVIPMQDGFDTFIREYEKYFYVLSLDGFRGERRDNLMQALEETGRGYSIIPPMKRLHLHGMEPHYFFGNDIMLLHKRSSIRKRGSLFLKRCMDITLTALSLPPLALLTALVWVLKRLEGSKSPLFYGGARIGMNGKSFPCWKFCTMKPGADQILDDVLAADPAAKEEWDKYKKLKKDPRVDSHISKLLRKTSLDELPQLWNVFLGDMSLVGPRPILPEQAEDYKQGFEKDYEFYISMRPGLTGLWQVSGRNETSFQQRVVWDNWYVRNWSLWHDIVILVKTVRVFLTGSGAY